MDSAPNPSLTPQSDFLSIKSSASKLPIKRKTSHSSSSSTILNPNTAPAHVLTASDEDAGAGGSDDDDAGDTGGGRNPPPFKFHRIWTEQDEIGFLQGLLECASEGLSFPRDLSLFYGRFSDTMSQPYTKSQLSEKLRRLRKKFRVISSRLARGLDRALLSPHDRALFDLSKKLWHPEFSSNSPFGAGNKLKKANLASNLPTIHELDDQIDKEADDHDFIGGLDVNGEIKLRDLNVEVGEQEFPVPSGTDGLGEVAARTVLSVFDKSLKEVRMALGRQGLLCPDGGSIEGAEVGDLEKRWREQRVAELDVLARRLRLVLEHSLQKR
ncbi:hypothetical protein NMG60_11007529 [Bertholletia excelsa]